MSVDDDFCILVVFLAVDGQSVGSVDVDGWNDSLYDENAYAIGNCFKTKEEAEFEIERQKVIVELKRFAEKNNERLGPMVYYINGSYYDDSDYFVIGTCGNIYSLGSSIPMFSSSDVAEKAIMKIGEDRLKKYYFGV